MKLPKKVKFKKLPDAIDPKILKRFRKMVIKMKKSKLYTEEMGMTLGIK